MHPPPVVFSRSRLCCGQPRHGSGNAAADRRAGSGTADVPPCPGGHESEHEADIHPPAGGVDGAAVRIQPLHAHEAPQEKARDHVPAHADADVVGEEVLVIRALVGIADVPVPRVIPAVVLRGPRGDVRVHHGPAGSAHDEGGHRAFQEVVGQIEGDRAGVEVSRGRRRPGGAGGAVDRGDRRLVVHGGPVWCRGASPDCR